jgi:Nif-specific regulatory protein
MHERVLAIAKAVLGELDVDRVLTSALDGLIELCGAERGMILLIDRDGSLLFEKARNLDRQDVENPEFQVSRTIISRVQSQGTPFFDADLPGRPIGSFGDSVRSLELIAVLCLPLLHEGEVFGVVYLDTRSRRRSFTKDTLAIAGTFSDFISLAAHNALDRRSLARRVDDLELELREKYRFEAIVGCDPKMVEVLKLVARVAASDATVLIEGESGTGKELVARALHFNSRRRDQPFVALNCGALPEDLIESELFGHVKGAFTGATSDRRGRFEQAHGGTLFLDEIADMSLKMQAKVLRALQEQRFERVGGTSAIQVDVRVVAATNKDLQQEIAQGRFREDLYFRLAVIPFTLPPLRERRGDIPLLARHILDQLKEEGEVRQFRLSAEAAALLESYSFPGNIRELQNVLKRAMLIAESEVIELRHLPEALVRGSDRRAPDPFGGTFSECKARVLAEFERGYLSRRLEEARGNIARAARLAGMDAKNFHTKLAQHGIDALRFKARAKKHDELKDPDD